MAAEKSKILIIGGTGYIGKFIVEASAKLKHPTFALIRDTTLASNPDKAKLIDNFKSLNVTIAYGDMYEHESLVNAIKQVDVVISAVGGEAVGDQTKIIAAIKQAGNIKRFVPSEFGCDVDRVEAVEPAASLFGLKAIIRRKIESEGIPFTYLVSNGFAGYVLPTLGQMHAKALPTDKIVILGDGHTKTIIVDEKDIAEYTIKAVDDPRTLNKILYLRPPANILSFNELSSIWETKIGKTLEKTYIPEDHLLNNIQDSPMPLKLMLAISHSVFVKGAALKFETDASVGVEATELYPEINYTTVDQYLNHFV